MKTASCADKTSSSIEKDKGDCSSLNKLVTFQHSSDCSDIPDLRDSVTTKLENDKTSISQEISGNWKNSLCIPGTTAEFSNFVQSTPESHRLTSDPLVYKEQKLDDRNILNLSNVSVSLDNKTVPSKIKNSAEVKESFSCKVCILSFKAYLQMRYFLFGMFITFLLLLARLLSGFHCYIFLLIFVLSFVFMNFFSYLFIWLFPVFAVVTDLNISVVRAGS